MRGLGLGLVLVTLLMPQAAACDGAQALPKPSNSGPWARDSVARAIVGPWVSDADPNGFVMIWDLGSGMVSIDAAGRFTAVGFFDGRDLIGLTRTAGRPGTATGGAELGALRARYGNGPLIEVGFAADLNAAPLRRETWRPHMRFGPPASPPAFEGPGDALPALGDFVYVEELPEAVEKVPPDYPDWARRKDISGTVLVQALIGRDGRVRDTKVVHSIPELDDYAIAAVKQWRFKPALAKGRPVAVWVAIPVRFTLH